MSHRMPMRSSNLRRRLVAGLALIVAVAVALPAPVQADPPPWAPAWGYRAKHGKKDKKKKQGSETVVVEQPEPFQIPYVIDLGRCWFSVDGSVNDLVWAKHRWRIVLAFVFIQPRSNWVVGR